MLARSDVIIYHQFRRNQQLGSLLQYTKYFLYLLVEAFGDRTNVHSLYADVQVKLRTRSHIYQEQACSSHQ